MVTGNVLHNYIGTLKDRRHTCTPKRPETLKVAGLEPEIFKWHLYIKKPNINQKKSI